MVLINSNPVSGWGGDRPREGVLLLTRKLPLIKSPQPAIMCLLVCVMCAPTILHTMMARTHTGRLHTRVHTHARTRGVSE